MVECVVQSWMDVDVYVLVIYVMCLCFVVGGMIGFESLINKIFWFGFDMVFLQMVFDILGLCVELMEGDLECWFDYYIFVLVGLIYVGLNEIQCNIIVECMFGLLKG